MTGNMEELSNLALEGDQKLKRNQKKKKTMKDSEDCECELNNQQQNHIDEPPVNEHSPVHDGQQDEPWRPPGRHPCGCGGHATTTVLATVEAAEDTGATVEAEEDAGMDTTKEGDGMEMWLVSCSVSSTVHLLNVQGVQIECCTFHL